MDWTSVILHGAFQLDSWAVCVRRYFDDVSMNRNLDDGGDGGDDDADVTVFLSSLLHRRMLYINITRLYV